MEKKQNEYYSSDEEVAWGPLTLREIKKDLTGKPKMPKSNRRKTDSNHTLYFTPLTTFIENTENEVVNSSSATSTYFTPNASLSRKDVFLENLAKVINSERCSDVANIDEVGCSDENNTLMQLLEPEKRTESELLDQIEQSLIENTIQSPQHEPDDSQEISTYFVQDESVIEISDDSFNSSYESQYSHVGVKIKANSQDSSLDCLENTTEIQEVQYSDTENNDLQKEMNGDRLEEQGNRWKEPERTFLKEKEEESRLINYSNLKNKEKKIHDVVEENLNKLRSMLFFNNTVNISGLSLLNKNNARSTGNDGNKNIHSEVVQNDSISEAASTESDSFVYTEPVMQLRESLDYPEFADYSSSSTESCLPVYEMKKFEIPVLKKQLKPPNKFDYVQSPVRDYIRKHSPGHDNFKVPLKPVKSKITTPNPKSPSIHSNHYKSVLSPVSVYIKNSPASCLKQNCPTKTIPNLKPATKNPPVQQNKENVVFPEVIYKPASKVLDVQQKGIKLPNSIQKLTPQPTCTKHVARIRGGESKRPRQLDGDLTLMNLSDDQDISIHVTQQAFIK